MKEQLQLKNHLKEVRTEANLSQAQLAEMVGVSRNTMNSLQKPPCEQSLKKRNRLNQKNHNIAHIVTK